MGQGLLYGYFIAPAKPSLSPYCTAVVIGPCGKENERGGEDRGDDGSRGKRQQRVAAKGSEV